MSPAAAGRTLFAGAAKPSDAPALPGWLRQRFARQIAEARAALVRTAKRGMDGDGESDAGVIADKQVKNILAALGLRTPNPQSAAAYRRDHARLLASGQTPADLASTFQHFNRLRASWKFGEGEAIRSLRREAEAARKLGDYPRMRALTVEAFDRAVVLETMFLAPVAAPARESWGRKAAALRAAGVPKVSRSKRAAGRQAPTPDQLLALLAKQPGRCCRVETAAAVFACFGVRPAEMVKGVRLLLDGDGVAVEVAGAKLDAKRGQAMRRLAIAPDRRGCSGLAVALLRDVAAQGSKGLLLSEADLAAVRRAMRTAQPGLSPYAYRHARASDVKATQGRAGAAAWLGHSSDGAQRHYGNARSSCGAVRVRAVETSRPVRRVRGKPPSIRPSEVGAAAKRSSPIKVPTWKRRRPR